MRLRESTDGLPWLECGGACGHWPHLDISFPILPATTPEGKLAKLGHEIGKNLDRTMKETMNYLKSLLPHAYEVTRP